ncbi:hypothetical protein JCM3774_002155 [Rhodotorula dairenensis]
MPRARAPNSPSLATAASAAAAAATAASTSMSTTSTVLNHTFAPFYACYLLKSYHPKRLNQTYIGSTPDPPRRYRQHMGETVGGAFKTRLARPWEMEAIVYGFPTKLQALQFEWAWQNPHASRLLHAPPAATAETGPTSPTLAGKGFESDDAAATRGRKQKSGGRTLKSDPKASKPVAQFPRTAASNRGQTRIQVLQYMLTVPPWRSFNLRVMLFSDLAQQWWDRARKAGPTVRTDAGWKKFEKQLEKEKVKGRDGAESQAGNEWGERDIWLERVQVDVRREGVDGERLVRTGERQQEDAIGRIRIDDDDFFKVQWSKWTELVSSRDCHLCSQAVDHADHLSFFLCASTPPYASTSMANLEDRCTALFHPGCLSSYFLSVPAEVSGPANRAFATRTAAPPAVLAPPLLPTSGNCPVCDAELHWADLVRSMYRRMEEVEGKRKKRTRQRAKAGTLGSEAAGAGGDDDDNNDRNDEGGGLNSDARSTSAPKKRKTRTVAAVSSAPAMTGRRKPTRKATAKSQPSESGRAAVQLGESFDFSSDVGTEDNSNDSDDGSGGQTRVCEDLLALDRIGEDENTDDESDNEERSFARLEAAQDALDFAAEDPFDDGGIEDDDDNDDDIGVDADPEDFGDVDQISSFSGARVAPLATVVAGKASTKGMAPSRRRKSPQPTATLTKSFGATKPLRSRVAAVATPAAKDPLPAAVALAVDDVEISPLAQPSARTAPNAAGNQPRKAVPAYIELSD